MNRVTNHDPDTGIAYGIIHTNKLAGWIWDEFDAGYGKPEEAECLDCGCETCLTENQDWGEEIECPECGKLFDIELPDGAEPLCHTFEQGGYTMSIDEHGDVWIFKSPYYTIAEKASPCAPGAGYLKEVTLCRDPNGMDATMDKVSNSMGRGEKTYCLPGDWFEEEIAPYPLWSVETGERVKEES